MAVIRVLDKHTAELIAAGEVVERPASVVKELLENAIDAGATQIVVTIESGGVRLIEVSDNGSGIEAEYISTAFIRHATSKIKSQEDLDHIHTLGFRGEALASIASVARVEVLTRTELDECACVYRIEGGEEQPLEPGARAVGTTIRVRDLFYNTPARMKFLKKDSSEGTVVADAVSHVALSHPEISFKFIREGKLQFVTPGDGALRSAAYAVLGREFARDLIPVEEQEGSYRVFGLITPPKSCRASRSMQHFYINGRYVRNRTMMAGMETAFKGTTMQGKFPGGVLMLEMPAELVDVNVHPAKVEVRFARENDVFDVVYHAVKLALAQPGTGERLFSFGMTKLPKDAALLADKEENDDKTEEKSVKENHFTGLSAVISGQAEPGTLPKAGPAGLSASQDAPVQAVPRAVPAKKETSAARREADAFAELLAGTSVAKDAPMESVVTLHSPQAEAAPAPAAEPFRLAANETKLDVAIEEEQIPDRVDHLAAWTAATPAATVSGEPEQLPQDEDAPPEQLSFGGAEEAAPLEYVGELFRTYLLAQRGDELCLIDKHAAHERQLYEKLAAHYGNVPSQLLLEPAAVDLAPEEKQALLDNIPLLENAGIEIDDFGGNTVVLRAVPADVEPQNAESLLVELADKFRKGSRDALNERTEWVLHSIACRAAIKAGDRTSPQELMVLAEKILSGEIPPFCPHGRPCVLKLTRKELEKQFGRIV
ncbi:MAG: DNA mismatch repair endonuclease MutL [Faecalibacterium sp.]